MTVDLETASALVTAGLAASKMDSHAESKSPSPAAAICANCKAVTSGRYCANCGQAAHVDRSLLHMVEEALHGLLHFDSKSWRTVPLLIARPGLLTRRYIEGQRVKYVSPLALLLFTTFLMFFALSMVHGVTLFDHAIFSLYSLSFMSLFFATLGLISTVQAIKWLAAICSV